MKIGDQPASGGGKPLANCGRRLRAAGKGKIMIAGQGTYRGALETVPTESEAGSLNVVNALALEQYAKGVMPNEVPPSWPTEELRAHALAVRSIALTGDGDERTMQRCRAAGCDEVLLKPVPPGKTVCSPVPSGFTVTMALPSKPIRSR